MNKPVEHSVSKAEDSIQRRLTEYAYSLAYEDLTRDAIHEAKVRIIDTLGALIGGYFGEPCRIVRDVAAQIQQANGVAVIGTRMKTSPDLAAFVNATMARYPELNDVYQWPGNDAKGHPSDALMAVLAAAEHAQADGQQFITAVVLAYEIYQRICDGFHNLDAFDNANFACAAVALSSAKLWALSQVQMAHALSMAVVPNIVLRQVKGGSKSMFKAVGPGQAGRAGVFATQLARAGMEGPHLPFEGKAGWSKHVGLGRFAIGELGGKGNPFKIGDSRIKLRPTCGSAISSVMAAEKISPLSGIASAQKITVETYKRARDSIGSGPIPWNPASREDADHSIPYLVAATLMDGIVTLRSFTDAQIHNPERRALMKKIEVVENPEFTDAFENPPQHYRSRVTVITHSGEKVVGESGASAEDDVAAQKSDRQINEKFRSLTEDTLGSTRVSCILNQLWNLERMKNTAQIAPLFVIG